MGYDLSDEAIDKVYERFKVLADKKKEVFEADIEALIEDELVEVPAYFKLEAFHVSSGKTTTPTAMVRLSTPDGGAKQDASCGDGPVDAVYKTIDRITGIPGKLVDYGIRAVTGGKDALGEVVLTAEFDGKRFSGKASSTDIIEASTEAYLVAVNRATADSCRVQEKPGKKRAKATRRRRRTG